MAKATVYMRAMRGGEHVTHDVPNGAKIVNREGVLVITTLNGLAEYFAAPMELIDHIAIDNEAK